MPIITCVLAALLVLSFASTAQQTRPNRGHDRRAASDGSILTSPVFEFLEKNDAGRGTRQSTKISQRVSQATPVNGAMSSFFGSPASFPQLWGMTSEGGEGAGTVFSMTTGDSTFAFQHTFPWMDGRLPTGSVIKAANGKLYGIVPRGGGFDRGIIFEFDPATNSRSVVYEFGFDGRDAYGSLLEASNGKLYGTVFYDEISYNGALFEFDILTSTYTVVHTFDNTNGKWPSGTLIQGSNEKLYGMSQQGGSSGFGVIFEYDLSTDTCVKLHEFSGTDGKYPDRSSLVQASNGQFYGITTWGGANEKGVLFRYDPSTSTYTKLLDFDGTNGSYPVGSLLEGSNGMLYGLTLSGGASDKGIIYSLDTATNVVTTKIHFDGTKGAYPAIATSMMFGPNGNMFGVTSGGGADDAGVIFEYLPDVNVLVKRHEFDWYGLASPLGVLAQGDDGHLYGLTIYGGGNDQGGLFGLNPTNNAVTTEFEFGYSSTGGSPATSLVQASNTKLYGMTTYGGLAWATYGGGVIFECDPYTNTVTKKYAFDDDNGSHPYGSLIEASNGKLYGTAAEGGTDGSGVLFEYSPSTNAYSAIYHFPYISLEEGGSAPSGQFPTGSLVQATDGKLYGMTRDGGSGNYGVLFSFDIQTSTFSKLIDFTGPNGKYPEGSLMQATDGKLYGMIKQGGANDHGLIFSFDPATSTFSNLQDFDNSNGSRPEGSLMQSTNGKLYGMTNEGGANYIGVIFEYDIASSTFTKRYDFNGSVGSNPLGSLFEARNGKLYGMASQSNTGGGGGGGEGPANPPSIVPRDRTRIPFEGHERGSVFEFDTSTYAVTNKFTFADAYGEYPKGELIEVHPTVTLTTSATYGSVLKNLAQTEFVQGRSVILTASPIAHYHFVGWGGDHSGTKNPDTLTLDSSMNVTASFAIDSVTLTITINGSGSVNIYVDASPITVSGAVNQIRLPYGTFVSNLTGVAGTGYHFGNWQYGAGFNSANPLFSILLDTNKSFTANFLINTYIIEPSVFPVGQVTLLPSTIQTVNYGSSKTFTVQTTFNHHIDSIMINGYQLSIPAQGDSLKKYTYTFENVTSNQTIRAVGSTDRYRLTTPEANGTVTRNLNLPNGYHNGTEVTCIAKPNARYHFTGWSGDTANTIRNNDTIIVTMNGHKTIRANFAVNTYTISVTQSTGGNIFIGDIFCVFGCSGTRAPSSITVEEGGNVTLYSIANFNWICIFNCTYYSLRNVIVDGFSIGARGLYTFTNVRENHTFTADFGAGSSAPPPSVLLMSPNGSEIWKTGSTRPLTWTSYGVDSVKLSLIVGGNQYVITPSVPSIYDSTKSYLWTIPSISTMFPGNTNTRIQGRVKIQKVSNGAVRDSSDAEFFIENSMQPTQTGTTVRLNDISFLGQLGYAVGSKSTVIYTTDGGKNWSPHPIAFADSNMEFTSVSLSKYDGAVYTTAYDGLGVTRIWRTYGSNHGLWNVETTFVARMYGVSTLDNNAFFAGAGGKILWMRGGHPYPRYFSPISNTDTTTLTAIGTFPNRMYRNGELVVASYAVGLNGTYKRIYSKEGQGSEVSTISTGYSVPLKDVFFVDSLRGWAVGHNGTILKTTDAGFTWTVQTSGTTNTLNAITMITDASGNVTSGWIVGSGGFIAKYTPPASLSGKNRWKRGMSADEQWSQVESGTDDDLSTLSITDDGSFVSVGDSGTALNSATRNLFLTSQLGGEAYLVGQSVPITWSSEGVDYITIEYSPDSGQTWNPITQFYSTSTGSYNWTLPGTPLEHVVLAISDAEDSTVADASDSTFSIIEYSGTYSVNAKWNLVSVPLSVSDYRLASLFPNATTNAFQYQGQYVQKETLVAGAGYWVKFETAHTVSMAGPIQTLDTIDVASGWNLIGSISSAVAVGNIGAYPSDLVVSNFYGYDGRYVAADSVMPGKGYWVKAGGDGKIILSSTQSNSAFNRVRIQESDELPPPPPEDGLLDSTPELPSAFGLDQNYPNPFNPQTVIRYQLPAINGQSGTYGVTLRVYNVLGQVVETIAEGIQESGFKSVTWNASTLPSGVYFYKLEAADVSDPARQFQESKKLLLLK